MNRSVLISITIMVTLTIILVLFKPPLLTPSDKKTSQREKSQPAETPLKKEIGAIGSPIRFNEKKRDELEKHFEKIGFISIHKIKSIFETEGFSKAWEVAAIQTDENLRIALQKKIMQEMAKSGRAEEALLFVQKNIGLGTRRKNLIYDIVSRSNFSLQDIHNLYNSSIIQEDKLGYIEGLKYQIMKNGLSLKELPSQELPEDIKSSLIEGLAINYSHKKDTANTFEVLSKLSHKEESAGKTLQKFLRKLGIEELKTLISESADSDNPLLTEASILAFRRVAIFAPEWVIRKSAGEKRTIDLDAIQNATMQLVKSDPNQAIKLLDSIASNDTALRSGIMSGLSRSAASKGEFVTAWEWSEKIVEPSLRKKVESKIWSQEQKSINQQTQSDPTGTLNSLISSDSTHAEYWIKDSFDTWSSNAPDHANAWYQENRETLTPSQNQHIARSYATQAIKQGDLDSAREWVEQVIDEKFQQAIREKIDAATTE